MKIACDGGQRRGHDGLVQGRKEHAEHEGPNDQEDPPLGQEWLARGVKLGGRTAFGIWGFAHLITLCDSALATSGFTPPSHAQGELRRPRGVSLRSLPNGLHIMRRGSGPRPWLLRG